MLTAKQEKFVGYFLRYADGKKAALAVGSSHSSAASQASQWLTVPDVAEAVKAGQERLRAEHMTAASEVIKETARLAFYDATKFVGVHQHRCEWCWQEYDGPEEDQPQDPDPDCTRCWGYGVQSIVLRDTRDLTAAERAPIEQISEGREGLKIKCGSKVAALTLLSKLLGLLVERPETTPDGAGVLMVPAIGTPEQWQAAVNARKAAK